MTALYVGANIAKNLVAPVVLPLARSRGRLGMDGDLGAVTTTLDQLADGLKARSVSAGPDVLELGPGRSPEVAAAFALAGARSVLGLDTTLQVPAGASLTGRHAALADALAHGAAARFRGAMGAAPEDVERRVSPTASPTLPMTFAAFDGRRMPVPESCIDLIVSKSVLEHVHADHVAPLVREMKRVLRPGGAMVHRIDLRDHMWIELDDVKGDWLDALRYPEPLFRLMFGNRSTSINRLRSVEWRKVFSEEGFEVVRWDEVRYALPDGFRVSDLRPRWRDLALEELEIGQIGVTLALPSDAR